jgi:hypothetical protein
MGVLRDGPELRVERRIVPDLASLESQEAPDAGAPSPAS